MKGKYIETKVRAILRDYPNARNSDRGLIIQFLQQQGAELTPRQIAVIKSVAFESLTRARRKIQEGGEYPANKNIKQERSYKAMRVQQIAPSAKPAYIADAIEDVPVKPEPEQDTLFDVPPVPRRYY